MENKPKKAETKKKKKFLSGSVLSSWYCRARPDPVGLRRQQLLRNLHKERDRSEMFHSQTPARTWHPTPPRGHGGLWLFSHPALGPGELQRDLSKVLSKKLKDGGTGHVWARHCDAGRGGGDGSNVSLNHYSSVTLQTFFFSLNKVISSRVAGD